MTIVYPRENKQMAAIDRALRNRQPVWSVKEGKPQKTMVRAPVPASPNESSLLQVKPDTVMHSSNTSPCSWLRDGLVLGLLVENELAHARGQTM